MNRKSLILFSSLAALVCFLFRKARGYSQMAQQITFLPKVYSTPKISWSELTIPICIDITNPTAEKADITVLNGSAIIAGKEVAKIKVPSDGASVTISPHATSRLKNLSIAIPVNNLLTTILDNLNDIMSSDFTKVISSTSLQFAVSVNGLATITGNMSFDKQSALGSLGLTASSRRDIKSISDYISLIPPRSSLKHEDAIRQSSTTPQNTVEFMHQVIRHSLWSDTTEPEHHNPDNHLYPTKDATRKQHIEDIKKAQQAHTQQSDAAKAKRKRKQMQQALAIEIALHLNKNTKGTTTPTNTPSTNPHQTLIR